MSKKLVNAKEEVNFLDTIKDGSLSKIKSFGNMTLSENFQRVEKALTKLQKIERVFGKSQTDFQTKTLNIGMEVTPEKSLSRIASEIQRKKMALDENKHSVMLCQVDIDELIDKELSEENDFEKQRIKINISKKRCELSHAMLYIEGAMKSILSLENQYDSIIKKCKNFNEVEFEKMELTSQVKKALRQSLEDMRETHGNIRKGEQQYLTGLGLNISKIKITLSEYLKKERDMVGFSNVEMDKFLNLFTEELVPYVKESIEHRGFISEYDDSLAYIPIYTGKNDGE